jgi:hypothetical protein
MLGVFCSLPLNAQEMTQDPIDFRQVLLDLMVHIEESFGVEPRASRAILESSDEELQTALDYIEDKERFLETARHVLNRIDSIKAAAAEESHFTPQELGAPNQRFVAGVDSFPPDYPPDEGWYHYNIIGPLRFMGLTQNVYDRCHDFDSLPQTEELVFDLEQAVAIGDSLCQVAGCDPFVLGCLAVCGGVETLKTIVWVLKLPMEMCKYHDGKIDSAEIEAAYENTVITLGNLDSTNTKIDGLSSQLTTHDSDIKEDIKIHDQDIKTMIETVLTNQKQIIANQKQIIELLNTPQGRRPDWNDKKK